MHSQDQNGLLHIQKFFITVININDKPTNLLLNGNHNVAVRENIQGAFIADIITIDEDVNQFYKYEIIEAHALLLFEIRNNKLFLKDKVALDYEQESVYNFSIVSTDSGIPQENISVTILVHVEDANEAPLFIEVSNLYVAENSPSTTSIGTINVTDPDNFKSLTQNHECWVTGSHLLFEVRTYKMLQGNVINELLVVKDGLDYELASYFVF